MTNPSQITQAVNILRAGGLVAFPTETVYGLGADATNAEAIQKIFAVKERPLTNPLIVHLASAKDLDQWVQTIPTSAEKLMQAFWPGPLTLIFKKNPHVLDLITGSQDTVGIRIPNHPIAQALLQNFGKGIAAPSANKFTRVSPTTAQAVQEELAEKVDLILDGGSCAVGLESTILDLSHEEPVILRPGMITKEMLENVLEQKIIFSSPITTITRAPGMHHLHYAPTTQTELMSRKNMIELAANIHSSVAFIMINPFESANKNIHIEQMSNSSQQYAHDLYQRLRELDHGHYEKIIIETVPNTAEWEAIRDRLQKASG